ncbi:hypothetical protein OC845_002507 [Tilletia horrida]|nr:hypothetical protein OC845_002507 [Tilletia horrida]
MTAISTQRPPALATPGPVQPKVLTQDGLEEPAPPLDPHDFVSRSLTPFNAEPRITALLEKGGFYTPQRLLFHRNRDPLPGQYFPGVVRRSAGGEEDVSWMVQLEVEDELRTEWGMSAQEAGRVYTLGELKSGLGAPRVVTATLECAGNRRSEMSQVLKTEGIQWASGVIANIPFVGLSLREFLLSAGIPDPYAHMDASALANVAPTEASIATHAPAWAHQTHVHFVSAQRSDLLPAKGNDDDDQENDASRSKEGSSRRRNSWFASSVSLATAFLPSQQCLLSWGICSNADALLPTSSSSSSTEAGSSKQERGKDKDAKSMTMTMTMEEEEIKVEPLEHAHGFPLRAVLPGHAGARWVKWIREIRIERASNASAPMKDDYKMLIPTQTTTTSAPADPEWVPSFKSAAHRAQVMSVLPPMMRLTAGSAISRPVEGEHVSVGPSGTFTVQGYAVGQDGSAVQSVSVLLVPDTDASLSAPELRARYSQSSQWTTATLMTRDAQQQKQLAVAQRADEAEAEPWVWSWTLWEVELECPSVEKNAERSWALIVKCKTTAGVEQVQTAPWNLRGFCQRSWPVVRGLHFSKDGDSEDL